MLAEGSLQHSQEMSLTAKIASGGNLLKAVQLCYPLCGVMHLEMPVEIRLQQFNGHGRKKRPKYPFTFISVLVILINQEIEVGLH